MVEEMVVGGCCRVVRRCRRPLRARNKGRHGCRNVKVMTGGLSGEVCWYDQVEMTTECEKWHTTQDPSGLTSLPASRGNLGNALLSVMVGSLNVTLMVDPKINPTHPNIAASLHLFVWPCSRANLLPGRLSQRFSVF